MTVNLKVRVSAHVSLGQSIQAARELVKQRIEQAISDPRSGLWPVFAVESFDVTIEDEPTAQASNDPKGPE